MRLFRVAAPLVAVLLLGAALAWQWYEHAGAPRQQPAASIVTPVPAATFAPMRTATPKPVVYAVAQPPHGRGSATVDATTVPLAGTATEIPQVPAKAVVAYVPPPPPVIRSQSAAPQIIAVAINTPVVRGGQLVSGSVETSTNVASVEARIGGYSTALKKVGAGRFALAYRVPSLPFFLRKTYAVELVARTTRGDAVSTLFPITVK